MLKMIRNRIVGMMNRFRIDMSLMPRRAARDCGSSCVIVKVVKLRSSQSRHIPYASTVMSIQMSKPHPRTRDFEDAPFPARPPVQRVREWRGGRGAPCRYPA